MDLLPTFVDIGGGEVTGTDFEGREVLPVRGRSFWDRVLGDPAAVHSEAVPILSGGQGALVRWPWKIVGPTGGSGGELSDWILFNLEDDPGETTDIGAQNDEIRAELVGLVPVEGNGAGR